MATTSESLAAAGIVADIAGLADEPAVPANPAFSLGFRGNGTVYTPAATATPPRVTFAAAKPDTRYTLVLTDPDAPDRASHVYREFVHWVVSDLTFAADGTAEAGTTVLPYVGPGPPCNSGLHRYVFLLYEQPAGAEPAALAAAFEGRGGKRAHEAARAAGLGPLVAVDWYEAQWDETVDAAHTAISFMPPAQFRSPAQKAQVAAAEEAKQ